MFAFDTSIISLAIDDSRSSLIHPATKKRIERPGDRVKHLLWSLSKEEEIILLPAPVVAELLVFAEDATEVLYRYISNNGLLQIAAFNYMAAIEMARALREKNERDSRISVDYSEANIARSKFKLDYQIVAIARTQGAEAIYSQDQRLNKHSERCGLEVRTITDIDLPPPDFEKNSGLQCIREE